MAVNPKLSLIVAGLVGLALSAAPLGEVSAQQQQPTTSAAEISEEKLDAFVDAALGVQQVQQDLNAELQGVENREKAQELQQQAQQQAAQAIEAQGLTTNEYTAILQAANNDRELYSTIVAMMEERRQ